MTSEEISCNRNALRNSGFESDLARDKAMLNFSFTMFMGLIAFFNVVKTDAAAMTCALLAMISSLATVYFSLKVLKNNMELTQYALSKETEPDEAFKRLLDKLTQKAALDGKFSHSFFWVSIILVVMCMLFYSGVGLTFSVVA